MRFMSEVKEVQEAFPEDEEDDQEEDDTKIPPIYNALAESLNVELVYIILKGITQFAYIHSNK